MKVAIVYDRVNTFGGAERILLALHKLWPKAPLYTSVYDKKNAPWAEAFPYIYTSFLNRFSFIRKNHEYFAFFMPIAFENFNFDQYKLVISVSSEAAKNIITKPGTLHLCYNLTPTRYLWSGYFYHKKSDFFGKLSPYLNRLLPYPFRNYRFADVIYSKRPDYLIAISKTVQERIKKYYRSDAYCIHPPVATDFFSPSKVKRGNYFLVVSRLVHYKRVEAVVEAFNILGWPLKIIGRGRELIRLQEIAHKNIEFISELITDEKLRHYYRTCKALIFPGEEDFGLVILEAQSCGTPVIALKKGGASETIEDKKTGLFFNEAQTQEIIKALIFFNKKHYNSDNIRKNALKYSENRFLKDFSVLVTKLLKSKPY